MVQSTDASRRECPTRVDGGHPLICHQIDVQVCQSRQRGHYHKCHTCLYRNDAGVPRVHVLPPERVPSKPPTEPVPLRVHRAS